MFSISVFLPSLQDLFFVFLGHAFILNEVVSLSQLKEIKSELNIFMNVYLAHLQLSVPLQNVAHQSDSFVVFSNVRSVFRIA